ncbi:Crp/Fnr family transcriptional regulator [Flavobacterium aurantiibacter]|uniref:cAMP-binding protein n=1 Tax=Flavobacterium aurantiibacter TaxID=2023067 RepID=A0A256A0Z4_9FLAO|nr:Crp/Fnr family transcriptional regulator [Flavobacterium aurantiibacter]OYQ47467.1 cAMP-binding protein [Flavobacterium aurantiibacter]
MTPKAIQTYLKTVKHLCPQADSDALSFLESGLTTSTLADKHFYIQANTTQKNVGFVFSGLLRAFYIDDKGNEITIRFAKEFDFATEYVAFITQTPSKYFFQCLEACEIVNIPYSHMQDAFSKFPALEKYGRLIAEEVLKFQQKRIQSFLFENAEQRYINFVKENSDLHNRVSLSYLSTYLGIERPSLSRIRKKIARR